MKKYFLNKQLFIIIFALLALLLALSMIFHPNYQNKPQAYDISVICAQGDAEHFINFRQGANQAAEDLNVNLRFLYSNGEDGVQHQKKYIQQELKNTTDAMVILPYSDHLSITQVCLEANKPIVYAYSHVVKEENNYVGPSNDKLGTDFALEIMRRGNYRRHIAILVQNDMSYGKKTILSSMQETFRSSINEVEVLSFHPQESNLNHILDNNQFDVVVCFDENLYDQLIAYKKGHDIEIYAIGSNQKMISALENEMISALLVSDDYSIGYLSVRNAVDAIKEGKSIAPQNIRYAIIDKDHMYQSDNERLLFPIVR